VISSTSNQTIKDIRALRQRKEREDRGTFWVEGIRLVGEAVRYPDRIELLIVAPELLTSRFGKETVSQLRAAGLPVLEVTPAVFASLSHKEGPQGVGAVVRQEWTPLRHAVLDAGLGWLALDRVADPGNLGTIMRTCDAVGVSGIVLTGDCTDPFDPAAVRGSMGAVFAMLLAKATEEEFAAWSRSRGANVVGTSDQGAIDFRQAAYTRPMVLLMGSERQGLSQDLLATCLEVVRIPMTGRSDSLNLAVATGIVLYEIFDRFHPIVGEGE
jgi:RNA methyltransferase, TrmH family